MNKGILFVFFLLVIGQLNAQNIWDGSTYPDEKGFEQRMEPMLERIASLDFGKRSLANSKCPDTGLPVKTWAVKGETIISPYTGRAYTQGNTGYFGPRVRNEKGEIIAFGGDPLKYDLPPATATLLLDKENVMAKAFLSIPGNLRQQYHFACKNWARFYPLLADEMGDEWKTNFYYWINRYAESRRPSDGGREMLPLSRAHDLIGEPGHLLGGNTKDGGTENHKTMWRSSALLYAQLFPDTAKISGYTTAETERLVKAMLIDYMQRILKTGNGEYDSQVYYPHSIEAFLNLYDFSPDEDTRMLAKFILDYYFVTYGLKVIDGIIAGGQKRGYLAGGEPNEMEIMQWAYFNKTSRDMSDVHTTIQQATTTYRPNKIIYDIVQKNLDTPFEGKMSRPFYHMDRPHSFAETFYCSDSYALGNVQMTIVDNPNQQMVWSLVAEGTHIPLCFSGGHPMRGSTSGHSPYTQSLQSKGSLIVLTAPTHVLDDGDTVVAPTYSKIIRPNLWHLPESEQREGFEVRNRQKYGKQDLKDYTPLKGNAAEDFQDFFEKNIGAACSFFYYPKQLTPLEMEGNWYFEANNSFIGLIPVSTSSEVEVIAPSRSVRKKIQGKGRRFYADYNILSFPGVISGYILESGEKSEYGSLENFHRQVKILTLLDESRLRSDLELTYTSLYGDKMDMKYFPEGLRCQARINGRKQNWDKHTRGAIYLSPYISVKNEKMTISNGKETYTVWFDGDKPVWEVEKSCSGKP